jgi:hypothetical protein
LHPGFPVGSTHYILGFPEGVFGFSLHLLGNALYLERCIAGQLARFLFDASDHFVGRTVHSIAIHWSTSNLFESSGSNHGRLSSFDRLRRRESGTRLRHFGLSDPIHLVPRIY